MLFDAQCAGGETTGTGTTGTTTAGTGTTGSNTTTTGKDIITDVAEKVGRT